MTRHYPPLWNWFAFLWLLSVFAHCGGPNIGKLQGQIQLAEQTNWEGIQLTLLGTQHRAVTNAEGDFTINGIEPGEYTLLIESPGYEAARVDVVIEKGETVKVTDVSLEPEYTPAGSVSGFITLQGESNYEDITVLLNGTSHTATTNTTGHFLIDGVEPGTYSLMAIKPGWLPHVEENVKIIDGEEFTLPEIQLESIQTIIQKSRRRQQETSNRVIRGVALLQGQNNHSGIKAALESNPDHFVTTEENGNFEISDLENQPYTIVFTREGYYEAVWSDVQPVKKESNTKSGIVTLREKTSEQTRGLLRGSVRLEGRTDHSNTLVRLQGISQSVVTDNAGQYMFIGIPPGQYTLTATHPGFETGRISNVTVAADQVTAATEMILTKKNDEEYEGAGDIQGSARLQGESVHGGVTVALEGTQLNAVTGENGGFSLTEVPTGAYTIIFSKGGYKDAYLRGIRVVSGELTRLEPVMLEKDVEPPYVLEHFPPQGARQVKIDEYLDVVVRFSERMDGQSVKNAVEIQPPVSYEAFFDHESELSNIDTLHLRFYQDGAYPVQFRTQYQIRIHPQARTPKGVAMTEPYDLQFTTSGPLIVETMPLQGENGFFLTPQNPIIIETNAQIDPSTIERAIRFRPRTDTTPMYKFVHHHNGSVIIVETTLRPDTRYTMQVNSTLRAVNGMRFSNTPFSLRFRTAAIGGSSPRFRARGR